MGEGVLSANARRFHYVCRSHKEAVRELSRFIITHGYVPNYLSYPAVNSMCAELPVSCIIQGGGLTYTSFLPLCGYVAFFLLPF